MNSDDPVVVIEDDIDDKEMLEEVFKNLGYTNELLFSGDGQEALDFLNESDVIPFIILSDINLPKLDGFALRDKIKMDANYRSNASLTCSSQLLPHKKLSLRRTVCPCKDSLSSKIQWLNSKRLSR